MTTESGKAYAFPITECLATYRKPDILLANALIPELESIYSNSEVQGTDPGLATKKAILLIGNRYGIDRLALFILAQPQLHRDEINIWLSPQMENITREALAEVIESGRFGISANQAIMFARGQRASTITATQANIEELGALKEKLLERKNLIDY